MSEKEIPHISVDCVVTEPVIDETNPKWRDWETSSIGSSDDLINGSNHASDGVNVATVGGLGWNLPTNDLTKAGTLDNLSVDSYWVGEDEIEEIEKEKQQDPVNPNYKAVYAKIQTKLASATEKKADGDNDKQEKDGATPNEILKG